MVVGIVQDSLPALHILLALRVSAAEYVRQLQRLAKLTLLALAGAGRHVAIAVVLRLHWLKGFVVVVIVVVVMVAGVDGAVAVHVVATAGREGIVVVVDWWVVDGVDQVGRIRS